MARNEDGFDRPRRMRCDTLLPLVRAAMARGEGPPAVLAFVRAHGHTTSSRRPWTSADEVHARVLAGRLAAALTENGSRGDPRTKHLGETFAAEFGSRG